MPDPPEPVRLIVEDAGLREAASYWPRLRKWIKAALRSYGLRVDLRDPEQAEKVTSADTVEETRP